MEIGRIKERFTKLINKYRYVLLIILIGIGLMMLPSPVKSEESETVRSNVEDIQTVSISEELALILSQVDGAGDVEVLLTVSSGEEVLYQTDEEISVNGESSSTQISTVVVSGTDRYEHGLIRQTISPIYQGAIVVCQGADDPKVQLAIVDAVANATGLGADRISVLKMK
ncbi:MAG: stage III sporulation protein AG [Oscillospiraceae bacterium]|nr:stage III sporulation protein AG [Oscillospiraceae bacterium]